MRWWILVALLLASTADAQRVGRPPFSGQSQTPIWLQCSALPDPAVPSFNVSPADGDLHAFFTANCGSGCILNLAPGTYDNTNITAGSNAIDSAVKVGSITSIGGEVLIRATDPTNKPLIRTALGTNKAAIFHLVNQTKLFRLENVRLDGKRASQTTSNLTTICTDTTPADGVCDSPSKSEGNLNGLLTRSTVGGTTRSCLEGVDIVETAQHGVSIRNAVASTVERATVTGAGCTPTACPALSIPRQFSVTAQTLEAVGVIFTSSSDVAVVNSTVRDITKIGIECFSQSRRCTFDSNVVSDTFNAGILFNDSDGTMSNNVISNIGFAVSPNTTADNVGHGIGTVNSDITKDFGLTTVIRNNAVSNTWNSGVQIGLSGATVPHLSHYRLEENLITGACNGTTRSDAAGLEMGDSGFYVNQIVSTNNTVSGSACPYGVHVRRTRDFFELFSDLGDTLKITLADWVSASKFTGTDLDIDASSKGLAQKCTLSGTVAGGAGVARDTCNGPIVGSSNWDQMVWDSDVWG